MTGAGDGDSGAVSFDARTRALDWLGALRRRRGSLVDTGQDHALVETCCAILILEGIGRLDDVSMDELVELGRLVQGAQAAATGLFANDAAGHSGESSSRLNRPAVRSTWYAIQALDALGMQPLHRLAYLSFTDDPASALHWLKGLDWSNAAAASELVASVLSFLVYRVEVEGDHTAARVYHAVLDELDELQDPATGLWGTRPGVPLSDAVGAVHRLLSCYEYVNRSIMRVSKIVDAVLGLHEATRSAQGTVTPDAADVLAVADVLATLGCQYGYRRDEIHAALLDTRRLVTRRLQVDASLAPAQHGELRRGPIEMALLRLLAMAAVDHACPQKESAAITWRFRRWPAFAFHRAPGRLNPRERETLRLWNRPTEHAARTADQSPAEPDISVVIPCYNLGRFLRGAVESVLAQTFENVEIVIVDDGSTDEYTIATLDAFDRPLTRVIRQPNGGVASARNSGIRATSGRYICCLDPDDRLKPTFLASAFAVLEHEDDVGLVTGAIEMVDERDEILRRDSCDLAMLLAQNVVAEPAVFRREGWERAGGYCGTFSSPGIEDWDFWITLCELGYRIHMLPEIVWEYRIRVDQMSSEMYKPDTWARLLGELVGRHRDSYSANVATVVSELGRSIAAHHDWIDDRNRSLAWWQRTSLAWQWIAEGRQLVDLPTTAVPHDSESIVPYAPAIVDPERPDFANTPASPRRRPYGYVPLDASAPPAVSIVSPFFNVGEVFHETARTVFRQSFQQWEWIIVNDGSTDPDALEVLATYRDSDPRIRVLDHPANFGLSAARNTGYRAARTPYVVQLDSDDLLEPTAVEKWYWFLETHPEYDFAKGYTVGFGAQQYLWHKGFHHGDEFLTMNLVNPTTIVRRSVHHEVGGYDEADRGGLMDWDFWLRCANAGHWGATVPELLDWYRRRATHADLWPDFDEGSRQRAYLGRLRKKYHRLWEGRFPQIAPRTPARFDATRDSLPCENRLSKRTWRVLFVVPWLACGGADRFNLDLLEQLTSLGWEATVATTLSADSTWAPEFARHTPDIFVLANFLHTADYPRFLKYVVHSRQIDVVVITHSELGYRLLPYLRASCTGVAFVDYCHIDEPAWKNGGYPRFSVDAREHLDLTVVSSQHLAHWMVREGSSPERVRVCYTNVDTEKWRPDAESRAATRRALDVPESAQVILFVGRICDQKQPRVLGDTFRRLRDAGVDFLALVAGGGPDLAELQEFVAANGLAQWVRLLGEVSNEHVGELMAAADIFFLPSRWEGISLAVYEAMASGLAIVGADVGGQRELVTSECGVLVARSSEADEAIQYAKELGRLIGDPTHRAELGRAARARVSASFKISTMGREMNALMAEARRLRAADSRAPVSREAGLNAAAAAIADVGISQAAARIWVEGKGSTVGKRLYVILNRLFDPAFQWGIRHGWTWLGAFGASVRRVLLR